ncbi:hypothetical protein L249_4084 [Ophiocordyceps polyrhachis-furcata BCC 54312]|uniref:Signal recognition particle subunit SRP68 n=1 Tax=Ophiocordyceps polyrhachis-furcata BCC 54312 TaxID=1330021 RepID=A0A367L5L5_9HYPO|nr:hypothetical protein L249_4084 [Ophiocordyceps polyrhachis-furcata BCC 54312]
MDITGFVVRGRDQALLYGDYATYHSQLAKRLLNSRKKLGIATKNRGKFRKTDSPTADQVAANHEYVHLLLLTSERAWAQAMSFKTAGHKDIPRRSRSHIVSRLYRAVTTAQELAQILATTAPVRDVLEAKAYAALLQGAMQFEKRAWQPCLQSYAVARSAYSALSATGNADLFKDLLSETIDPYIRYAAYQLKTPRTVPIPSIVAKAFPWSDAALVSEINQVDPTVLGATSGSDASPAQDIPKTLIWRSRQVQIEDAQISQAWAFVLAAKSRLTNHLAQATDREPRKVAAAYDELLTATQDAVDATKQAIDELKAEGVAQSDSRMQSLLIARTAVNYEMICWRIGRNRVLTGPQDGAPDDYDLLRRTRAKAKSQTAKQQRKLPTSRKLARLREKVALYDGTLQSLKSIKELPGVAADEPLSTNIQAFENYFDSLRLLSIARSHALVGNFANALALISRAVKLRNDAASSARPSNVDDNALPLGIDVSSEAVSFLGNLLDGELQRHRALVHIESLREEQESHVHQAHNPPLIDRLDEYPVRGVDHDNLVDFPPKMQLVPIKPIFLDVAWNYISYPGKAASAKSSPATAEQPSRQQQQQQQQQTKRGWFSFGRS